MAIQETINKALGSVAVGAGLYAHTPEAQAKKAEKRIEQLEQDIIKSPTEAGTQKAAETYYEEVEKGSAKYAGTSAGARIAKKLPNVTEDLNYKAYLQSKGYRQAVEQSEIDTGKELFWDKRYNEANENSTKALDDATLAAQLKAQQIEALQAKSDTVQETANLIKLLTKGETK